VIGCVSGTKIYMPWSDRLQFHTMWLAREFTVKCQDLLVFDALSLIIKHQ
jgi:hypothetical protein